MRIIVTHPGPGFSVADVHRGWVNAFRKLGVTFVDFNLHDRLSFYSQAGRLDRTGEFVRMVNDEGAARLAAKGLEAACYEFNPDILFIVSCFYLPLDTLDIIRARGTKVVILHTEEPYEHGRSLQRGAHADLNLVNDPIHLDEWRTLGPAEYVPHAYDPAIHCPGKPKSHAASDFCFVGTGYPERIKFLEAVDWSGVDLALAGNWQWCDPASPLRKFLAHDIAVCCDNTEAVELYRAAKMSCNIYRQEAERPDLVQGYAMGPREIEMAATGLFYVAQPRQENRDVLGVIPTFETPDELSELIRYYLPRDDERETIAAHARAKIADRTFENGARRFLTLAERL